MLYEPLDLSLCKLTRCTTSRSLCKAVLHFEAGGRMVRLQNLVSKRVGALMKSQRHAWQEF